jgi:hypothetical protein
MMLSDLQPAYNTYSKASTYDEITGKHLPSVARGLFILYDSPGGLHRNFTADDQRRFLSGRQIVRHTVE